MNLETLKMFCKPNTIGAMGTPWTCDGFTYASCGFVLIRVPAMDEVPPGGGVKVTSLYATAGPIPEDGWVEVPDLPPMDPCRECDGGKGVPKCPECNGNGEVTLSNAYNVYEVECMSCDGNGRVDECPVCDGSGLVETLEEFEIQGAAYSIGIIRKLKELLPGLQIHPSQPGVNWARFEGGDALVMRKH